MKNAHLIICLSLAFLCAACDTKTETPSSTPLPVAQEEEKVSGPQTTRPWNYAQTVELGGKQFEILLERKADSTLQIVKDAEGLEYLDNKIRLCVTVDSVKKVNRTFTKYNFESYMASGDISRCMLHGLAFDEVRDGLLLFGAQVGTPDEDVNYYFLIKIDKNGGLVILHDDRPDIMPSH